MLAKYSHHYSLFFSGRSVFFPAENVNTDVGNQSIKIEIIDQPSNNDGPHENITDLQNYLQTFNKEILTVQAECSQTGKFLIFFLCNF